MQPFLLYLLFVSARFLVPVLAAFIALGCSTELEVDAPYQERKVIYSILDPTLNYQIIRVSKGFLTDGRSALEVARMPDSLLYDTSIVRVELVEKIPNRPVRTFLCRDTLIKNKEAGIFYYPDQLSYVVSGIRLDTSQYGRTRYTVRVTNRLSGLVAEGETDLPSNITRIESPIADISNQPPTIFFPSKGEAKIRITRPSNVEMLQMRMVWNIAVLRTGGDTIRESWVMESPGTFEGVGNQPSIEGRIGPGTLYDFLAREVRNRGNDGVVGRKFEAGRLEVFFANSEYYRYKTVNNNYNVITQSLPIYTNVRNGLGVVCSRNFRSFPILLDRVNQDSAAVRVPEFKRIR